MEKFIHIYKSNALWGKKVSKIAKIEMVPKLVKPLVIIGYITWTTMLERR